VPLTGNVLQVAWQRARTKVGRNDLRCTTKHTGLTLAAATGATTVELMHRAGHSSSVAAMRYQHATKIAIELSLTLSARSQADGRRTFVMSPFSNSTSKSNISSFWMPNWMSELTLGTYGHSRI